ncbi:hypothetical protein AB1Y20_005978 [Prymnesium parvum]|uniref:OCEL domain-containing protein n=1 Tax=Prymnesium parvum TaxID=97485 RepID=A0AB34J4G1_PRYPA
MDITFGGDAACVATMRLPADLVQRLADATSATSLQITFAPSGEGVLECDGERYPLVSREEGGGMCELIEETAGRLAAVGVVSKKLTVRQGGAADRLRAGYEQADVEKRQRRAVDVAEASKKAKTVKTTTRVVPPPAARPAARSAPLPLPPPWAPTSPTLPQLFPNPSPPLPQPPPPLSQPFPLPLPPSLPSPSPPAPHPPPSTPTVGLGVPCVPHPSARTCGRPAAPRPACGRVAAGREAAAAAAMRESGGRAAGAREAAGEQAEELLSEWCIHRLALGPKDLAALEKAMHEAQTKKLLSQSLQIGSLNRVLTNVAQKQENGRFQLLTEKLAVVRVDWEHYAENERSTLRAVLFKKGILSQPTACAPAPAASAPSAPAAERIVVTELTSEKQYLETREKFGTLYKSYKQLDEELAQYTKRFERMEEEYEQASGSEKEALAKKIRDEFRKAEPTMQRKVEQQRQNHVQLKAYKNAVNSYVDRCNKEKSK